MFDHSCLRVMNTRTHTHNTCTSGFLAQASHYNWRDGGTKGQTYLFFLLFFLIFGTEDQFWSPTHSREVLYHWTRRLLLQQAASLLAAAVQTENMSDDRRVPSCSAFLDALTRYLMRISLREEGLIFSHALRRDTVIVGRTGSSWEGLEAGVSLRPKSGI